jgi:probable F420-dependent oxidoreductase
MKVGLFGLGSGRLARIELIRTVAVHTERLGFSTLWVPEHVVLLDSYASRYPYTDRGQFPMATTQPLLDPFIALATIATLTSKIRLATGICLVPEHNPLVLGKVVATLDYLSGGRFILGVGIGWLEEEFRAIGIPWEHRARRTREYIEAMRQLWGAELSSYSGEFVRFENVRCYPKPVSGAKLPIFFGGETPPALKRVADLGDGWCGFNVTADEAAAGIHRIHELMRAKGRKPEEVEFAASAYTKPITPDDMKRYRDAGVQELVLVFSDPPRTQDEMVKRLEEMARQWVEPAAALG